MPERVLTVGDGDLTYSLALARAFDLLFVDAVPLLDVRDLNRTRRFITLVDALYEHHCTLVCRAAAPPLSLFVADKQATTTKDDHGDLLGDATYVFVGVVSWSPLGARRGLS